MVREQVAKMTQRRNDLASALRWALSDCSRPSAAEPRYSAHAGGKGRGECQRNGDIMEVLPRLEAAAAGGVARGWPPTCCQANSEPGGRQLGLSRPCDLGGCAVCFAFRTVTFVVEACGCMGKGVVRFLTQAALGTALLRAGVLMS